MLHRKRHECDAFNVAGCFHRIDLLLTTVESRKAYYKKEAEEDTKQEGMAKANGTSNSISKGTQLF